VNILVLLCVAALGAGDLCGPHQIVRTDMGELYDMDLKGKPLAYTPMCDNNVEMEEYPSGSRASWKDHLQGWPVPHQVRHAGWRTSVASTPEARPAGTRAGHLGAHRGLFGGAPCTV